jgi:hypothetical protein
VWTEKSSGRRQHVQLRESFRALGVSTLENWIWKFQFSTPRPPPPSAVYILSIAERDASSSSSSSYSDSFHRLSYNFWWFVFAAWASPFCFPSQLFIAPWRSYLSCRLLYKRRVISKWQQLLLISKSKRIKEICKCMYFSLVRLLFGHRQENVTRIGRLYIFQIKSDQ